MMAYQPKHSEFFVESIAFSLPSQAVELTSFDLSEQEKKILMETGQEKTYLTHKGSTDLAISSAKNCLEHSNEDPKNIDLVISAPALITSYGLDIPAVAVGANLNLTNAQFLNIQQGCGGALIAIKIAAQHLEHCPEEKKVLVSTYSVSSSLMKNQNFGAFFWADGAASFLVSKKGKSNLMFRGYSEITSFQDWGAMHIPFGDSKGIDDCNFPDDFQIQNVFKGVREKMQYIEGEVCRFQDCLNSLLEHEGISDKDLNGIFLPSTGKNRLPMLFKTKEHLLKILCVNHALAHMGAVDLFWNLKNYIDKMKLPSGYFAMLSPTFTAQWSGVLFSYKT
jgi:3-oxoacyl-[acyl-carrier-protein] synthase III